MRSFTKGFLLSPKPERLRIRSVDRILFTKRLSLYLRAGIPILEALELIQGDLRSGPHATLVSSVMSDVREGIPLSAGLSRFPRAFPAFHVQFIAVGETSGTLSNALTDLSKLLDRRARLTRSVLGTLAYPTIVLFGTFGISGFLIFYAFPKIVPLFRGLHTQLPFTTRSLLFLSNLMRTHGWHILFGLLFLSSISIFIMRQAGVRKFIDTGVLRAPLLGKIVQSYNLSIVFNVLGVLLHSGVRIDVALGHARKSVAGAVYKESLYEMEQLVLSGQKSNAGMRLWPHAYPSLATQLIAAGEMTGTLSESAHTVAEIYEELLDEQLRSLSTLLEPALMILMGLVVGFVALAIITPMYSLTQSLSVH